MTLVRHGDENLLFCSQMYWIHVPLKHFKIVKLSVVASGKHPLQPLLIPIWGEMHENGQFLAPLTIFKEP